MTYSSKRCTKTGLGQSQQKFLPFSTKNSQVFLKK